MRRRPGIAGIGAIVTLTCGWIVAANFASGLPSTHSPFFPEENYTLPMNTCDPVQRVLENMHPASGSVTFTATDGPALTLTMSTVLDPYNEHSLPGIWPIPFTTLSCADGIGGREPVK